MKLIIELPDKKYKWIKEDTLCYTDEISEAIRNGIPLKEELEEIKADIDDLKCYVGEADFRDRVFELLDKRIKEINNEETI